MQTERTTCCVVGGGPAGVMLGFLLARGGVDVLVLEKHKDFFRDFRGDTIHPSTLQLMYELGLLCIGDSAHAMSPVGGVGINLAIQDAVATANLLVPKLLAGPATLKDLKSIQSRRERPARLVQRMQIFLHEHLLERIFDTDKMIDPPLLMNLTEKFPALRRLPARIVGMGFRPEHAK